MKNFVWYAVCSVLMIFLWNSVAFALPSGPTMKPISSFFSSIILLFDRQSARSEIDPQSTESIESTEGSLYFTKPIEKPNPKLAQDRPPINPEHYSIFGNTNSLQELAGQVVPNESLTDLQKNLIMIYITIAIALGDENSQLYPPRFFDIKDYNELRETHPLYKNNSLALSFMILARMLVGMQFRDAAIFLCQLITDVSIFYPAITFLGIIEMSFQNGGVCQ